MKITKKESLIFVLRIILTLIFLQIFGLLIYKGKTAKQWEEFQSETASTWRNYVDCVFNEVDEVQNQNKDLFEISTMCKCYEWGDSWCNTYQ